MSNNDYKKAQYVRLCEETQKQALLVRELHQRMVDARLSAEALSAFVPIEDENLYKQAVTAENKLVTVLNDLWLAKNAADNFYEDATRKAQQHG